MNFDEIAKVVHGNPDSIAAILDAFAVEGVRVDKFDFTLGRDFAVVVSHKIPDALVGHLDFVPISHAPIAFLLGNIRPGKLE